jgi:preprotein translocase subunit SecG
MKKITYLLSHLLFIIALVVNGLNSTRSFAEEAQKEASPYFPFSQRLTKSQEGFP